MQRAWEKYGKDVVFYFQRVIVNLDKQYKYEYIGIFFTFINSYFVVSWFTQGLTCTTIVENWS